MKVNELEHHTFDVLKNTKLESTFAVIGSDKLEAQNLFTESFTDLLEKLSDKLEKVAPCKISMAILDRQLYLAIHWDNNFFEYSINKTVEEEVIETMAELQLCTGIVEDLKLNTRIWN